MHRQTPDSPQPPSDRRQPVGERRRRYWSTLWKSLFAKRRATLRRHTDIDFNVFFDHHEPHLFALILSIILLCVADAYLTLNILDNGGQEVNPFMRALLEWDVRIFFVVKYIITAFCLVLALTHRRFHAFRLLNGEHVLWWTFAIYVVLVNYEVAILI